MAEFFGATEIVAQRLNVLSVGNPLPEPTKVDTGSDYESLEHMRVVLVEGQTYVGTNRFGESFLVPGTIDERVHRTDPEGRPHPINQVEGALSVATWNLFNVFDEKQPDDSLAVPSIPPPEQEVKRQKIARAVVDDLGAPAVVAVQEVENLDLLEAIGEAINDYLASPGDTRPSS